MYKNKKMFILGMARSGYEAAKLLANKGAVVTVNDASEQNEEHVKELTSLGVEIVIGQSPVELLNEEYDYLVKNPGIKLDHPAILKAKELNIPVINEVEVAYQYLKDMDVKIVGITGSNGKTTTTTLTYNILKNANLPVHLGGNIGYPVCSLVSNSKKGDILVLEIAGHQLHDTKDFKTDIAIMTNLSEVHLDHFGTYDFYKYNKTLIFRNHTENEVAIINGEDSDVLEQTKDIKSTKILFSSKNKHNLYLENDAIYFNKEEIIKLQDIKLKGNHNYENIMCAIAVAKQFNVSNEIIKEYLNNFGGVEHRMEYVDEVGGIKFYNDSKATNVESTKIALSAFTEPTVLLLGGLDRGHFFDELKDYTKNTKAIIGYGETKEKVKDFANSLNIENYIFDNLEQATKKAYEISNKGDVVLLSPSCASWDQYKKFEDRGNHFKEIIKTFKK